MEAEDQDDKIIRVQMLLTLTFLYFDSNGNFENAVNIDSHLLSKIVLFVSSLSDRGIKRIMYFHKQFLNLFLTIQ